VLPTTAELVGRVVFLIVVCDLASDSGALDDIRD
jgi:hypothetical protein